MDNGKGALLIIGGSKTQLDVLPRRLEEAGYPVAVARDGQEGLTLLERGTSDLVLLDIHTSVVDALEILARIKVDSELRDIPVILLAPPGDLGRVEQGLASGAEDYLLSPISPTLLKTQVREYLEIGLRRQQQRDRVTREESLKLERDIQIARQIQLSFLPRELPQPAGWEFGARFYPARDVAGDFYDVFTMTQGRRVGFVMADVCDKGVGAALFMALVRSLTRAFAQQNYSLGLMDTIAGDLASPMASDRRRGAPSMGTTALKNAVLLTNNYITTNHLELNMFATLFFGMLDPASGQLAYINAGHNPPFVVGADGVVKTCLKSTGPAVGMFPDPNYRIEHTTLEPGDALYAYTDGVTEARDPSGAFFTEKRLESLLARPPESAAELLERIDQVVHQFSAGTVQADDITMMAIRRIPAVV